MIGMIYITGDCHQDFKRFSTRVFPEQKEMTKDDSLLSAVPGATIFPEAFWNRMTRISGIRKSTLTGELCRTEFTMSAGGRKNFHLKKKWKREDIICQPMIMS